MMKSQSETQLPSNYYSEWNGETSNSTNHTPPWKVTADLTGKKYASPFKKSNEPNGMKKPDYTYNTPFPT